jgi:hypothetical protein
VNTFENPDVLIEAFGYQFPEQTAGKVVFRKATFHIFAEVCQQIDAALGDDKRGFHWSDTRTNRFKFNVTRGEKSSDLAQLCHGAMQLVAAVPDSEDLTYTNEPLTAKWWTTEPSSVMNPEQLIAALPYQFAGKNIGITFHRGWQDLFVRLCFAIDEALGEDKRGFHWTQVKEKFGSLRAYTHLDPTKDGSAYAPVVISEQQPNGALKQVSRLNESSARGDPVGKRIGALIEAACDEAAQTCCVCARPAKIKNLGWVACLCDYHEKQFLKNRNSLPAYCWSPDSGGDRWWA